MQLIAEFLAKYHFARFDREKARIKLASQAAKFFHAFSPVDMGKTLKPPKGSLESDKLEEKSTL